MILDIFNDDAFSFVEMNAAIDRQTFKPQGLGNMGIFTQRPIRTESIGVEQRDGQLSLIQTSERGAPLEQSTKTRGSMKSYSTVRFGKADRILASELQFLRQFGQEQQIAQLTTELARRLGGGGAENSQGLIDNVQLTHEHMRLGAVQGIVLDADGTPIIDWTSEFNGTGSIKTTEFNFSSNDGTLRKQCVKLKRDLIRNAKGVYQPGSGIHALCGDNFYDELIRTPDVIKTFAKQEDAFNAVITNQGEAFEKFTFGGIVWENYRGTDDNSAVAIDVDECHIFPVRAPGLFMEVWSPGEKFEDIGAEGKPFIVDVLVDEKRGHYVDLEAYSYPLHVCTNTNLLYKGTFVKP